MKYNTKKRIIKEISKRMYLREDVVEDVINEFINSIIVETVKNGEIIINDFISIKSFKWKGYKQSNRDTPIEEHYRLNVRISKNLRILYKNFGPHSENPNIITPENWKKLLKISKKEQAGEKPRTDKKTDKKENKFNNPFFD